jgi:mannose-1-phosphate guanylyltransferase/mannose-6-phosphate isomerase
MLAKADIVPVVLCGGAGKRLWPLSRLSYPKQFLKLADSRLSLFQQTLKRISGIEGIDSPVIVTNIKHKFLILEQCREINIKPSKIILEPESRNTCAAITSAALYIRSVDPEKLMLVMPSDHFMQNPLGFYLAVSESKPLARNKMAVTFGIRPTYPETGYGYIKAGSNISSTSHNVDKFVEKPDKAIAEEYIKSGNYYWNSGMFVFNSTYILREIAKFQPLILARCRKAFKITQPNELEISLNRNDFAQCPSISIDKAVMEHTKRSAIIPMECGWKDVGSWNSVYDINTQKSDDLVRYGKGGDIGSKNSLIYSDRVPIYTIGANNLVIISTPEAVLVANKDRSQEVQNLVSDILHNNKELIYDGSETIKPWGRYEIISQQAGSKVKKLFVNEGQSLSMQYHNHRSEIWAVVCGNAIAEKIENSIYQKTSLSAGDTISIPKGSLHKLTNSGTGILEVVEIQLGSYLEEDDIVRISDSYGRADITEIIENDMQQRVI